MGDEDNTPKATYKNGQFWAINFEHRWGRQLPKRYPTGGIRECMREAKLLYLVPNSFGLEHQNPPFRTWRISSLQGHSQRRILETMRGAGSVLKLVLIVSASPMAMSKTCLASWRADAWPYRLSLAGHEFPSENHHKNDYSGDISPSAALLELLMVYHGAPYKPYYGIVGIVWPISSSA
jgi:hypothetical protein